MFGFTRDGADFYFFDVFFQTPLLSAAGNGRGDVVEILLLNGANINEKDVRISSLLRSGIIY